MEYKDEEQDKGDEDECRFEDEWRRNNYALDVMREKGGKKSEGESVGVGVGAI